MPRGLSRATSPSSIGRIVRVNPAKAGVSLAQMNSPSPKPIKSGAAVVPPPRPQGHRPTPQPRHKHPSRLATPPERPAATTHRWASLQQTPDAIQLSSHQMRNHLRVRFRDEHHPTSRELIAQAAMVFNNAVLHHGHCPEPLRWGCALCSSGLPWVAQRVWPMPQKTGRSLLLQPSREIY